MKKRGKLEYSVLALTTLGLAIYLFWLVFRPHRIFYTQDGVLYLLPCVPLFFIYLYLLKRRHEGDEDVDDSNRDNETKG